MRKVLSLAVCWVFALFGLVCWSAAASAAEESSALMGGSSLSGNPLVVGGEELLVGGQQAAAEEAKRTNPEAVAARVTSESAYEGMSPEAAEKLAGETFRSLIDEPNGGPPRLPMGQRLASFIDPYAAEVSLSGGERGLVESTVPMALETSSGGWSPVGLGLRKVGGGFEPANPLVAVQARSRLSEGMQLSGLGLSVTPVDEQHSPLGGSEGVVDGNTEFFANTQTDSDTVFKPSVFGFSVDTVLRSAKSPSQLSFRLNLPAGAILEHAQTGSGSLLVIKGGVTIASIPAPSAQDASGAPVPVSMTVSDNILTLTVARKPGEFAYPIAVDPEFNWAGEALTPANWHHGEVSGGKFSFEAGLDIRHEGSFPTGNWAYYATQTKGVSKIYMLAVADSLWSDFETEYPFGSGKWEEGTEQFLSAWIELFKEGHESPRQLILSGFPYKKTGTVCANSECSMAGGIEGNLARFEVTTVESSQYEEERFHLSPPYGGSLTSATSYISQPKETHSTVNYNHSSTELSYKSGGKEVLTPNVLYGEGKWIGPNLGAFEYESTDLGLGVSASSVEVFTSGKWTTARSKNYLTEENGCIGVQCGEKQHEVVTWSVLSSYLANGEDKIRVAAHDPMSGTSSSEHGEGESILKVDSEAPDEITLSGLVSKNEEYELGEIEGHLKVKATDGTGSTPSSGVKSLGLEIDGASVGTSGGSCSPGPCKASMEWSLNGAEIGTGEHALTIVATDNAGNVSSKTFALNVYRASPVTMGPGSVNPESGDFALEAADVNLSGGMGTLTVSRHYDSRNPAEGAGGALGPQWSISLGSLASLEVLPDESVMIVGPEGLTHFTKKEGKFEAPEGDSSLALEYRTGEYLLSNKAKGTTTRFTLPSGATTWMPTTSTGPVATDTTTDEYETAEPEAGQKIVEPTLELAPHPSTTCVHSKHETKWEAGCRGLAFVYATATTATGENPTQWGEYTGRLKEVIALLYNPVTKKLQEPEPVVAKYEYDAHGRLRVEWDPRITPALKTTYGYDAAGHVTALTPPGQQPWTFMYGTIPSDPSLGRLLKVTQGQPKTGESEEEIMTKLAAEREVPKNTEAPKMSGTPVVGEKLGVSTGVWSNSPISYGYQWEDCNSEGGECTPILGASNPNYTVASSDVGYRLVAQVSALNGGGTQASLTEASAMVVKWIGAYKYSSQFAYSEIKHAGDILEVGGKLWVLDEGQSRLDEFNEKDEFLQGLGKEGTNNAEFQHPDSFAAGSGGALWVADTENNRVDEIVEGNWAQDFVFGFGVRSSEAKLQQCDTGCKAGIAGAEPGQLSHPGGIAWQGGHLWVSDSLNGRIEEFNEKGEYLKTVGSKGSGAGQLKEPEGLVVTKGDIWVADKANNRIKVYSEAGEFVKEFGTGGSVPGDLNGPDGVGFTAGDLLVTDTGNNRVDVFNEGGEYVTEFGSKGSGEGQVEFSAPVGVGTGPSKEAWVTNPGNNHIQKWIAEETRVEGENYSPQPGSTIEYNVPVSGTGAPHEMSAAEVSKWGEKDDPAVAAAIFPPDEPQSWPATQYKRATTTYMDSQARTVNVASPNGGISTSEYDAENNVIRTLSPANLASAMSEGCESKGKCKSAEVAATLDTESKYAEEGSELTESIGPLHRIRLASGSEVEARSHVKYNYDEGAPEGEEYGLVTKTVDSSLVAGKEEEPRTTRTYYSGQKGLGWKLRQPTSTVTDPTGIDLTHTTVYNETTGNVVETKMPGGTSENVSPPTYATAFGKEGTGNGQFKSAFDAAIDSTGNVWVVDKNNHRVEKFSSTGSFSGAYGAEGTSGGDYEEAWGIAVNQSNGNVYITDSSDNRIEELNASGSFLETIGWGVSDGKAELEVCKTSCRAGTAGEGNGQFNYPIGITIDAHGNLWVADDGNNRVQELTEAGTYVTKFGSYGTGNGQFNGSRGIAISEGDIYVVDHGNNRVEEFSPTGTYLNQFGSTGKGQGQFEGPAGIAVNPNSSGIYVSDPSEDKIEEYSPAGKFLVEFGMWGSGHDQFENPKGLAVNASGDLYVTEEYGNRVDELAPPGAGGAHMTYSTQWGSAGAGEGQFYWPMMSAIDGSGNIWSTDLNNSRVEKFSPSGKFLASYGKWGAGEVQFKKPTGIAINQSTGNVYIADCENNRIEELSSTGTYVRTFGSSGTGIGQFNCPGGMKIDSSGNVWVADTKNNRIQEFSPTGTFTAYGSKGTGNGQFNEPTDIAISGSDIYVTDTGNDRVQELSTSGTYITQFGSEGNGGGNFFSPQGIATDASGHLYVSDSGDGRIEQFTASGEYLASFGTQGSGEGQFTKPNGVAITSAGNMVVTDSGDNRIQLWANTNQAVHDTKTIYYTAGEEAEASTCRKHPEWVNLACETLPAVQPETPELPNLPVSTIKSYNVWNEPETVTETFGTTTRTRTTTFDSAGRALTSEVTAPIDTSVSAVKDKYDEKTGALTEEANTSGGKEVTLKRVINTLGQLEKYTDADGSITTYKHDIDGRVTEVANVIETGGKKESTYQKYGYDETTGLMTKLEDSGAGTFGATRDVEGRITSETYPNAMTAFTTYGAAGEAISIRYDKTAHCEKTCPETWFKEAAVPASNGEAAQRTNTLTSDAYSYDAVGRLVQVQETPVGKGCVIRLYGYDEESNRRSLTSRAPGAEGKCATEGGTTETHTYDTANRLTDPGVSYETLGNITKVPGADAGGPEMEIKTEYYADGQAASQTQNGKTYKYQMDPAGRVRETKTEAEGKTSTAISHYAGAGSALSWTSEEEGKSWTRNIPGIDGSLTAIQPSSGIIKLQIHDLQGNVVETASDLETETKLLSSYNSTEFGAPLNGTPPKYAWLGAAGVSTEQASGLVTQDGLTYVPQVGRPLQTQGVVLPIPDSAATAYVSTIEAGIDVSAAAASAQQVANAEQARWALEAEQEDEPDPEHGRNVLGCKVTASWGRPVFPGAVLVVWGHYNCNETPEMFQMQIAILLELPNGTFVTEHTKFHEFTFHELEGEEPLLDFGNFEWEFQCKELKWYKAWVWGRYTNRLPYRTEWQGSRFDGRKDECGVKVINVPETTPPPPE